MRLIIFASLTLILARQSHSARNLTGIIPADYDKYELPDTNNPTVVEVTAHVLSIPIVDSAKQTMTIDLYFRQRWKDARLRNQKPREIKGGVELHEAIWTPDTFFVNEISSSDHTITKPNTFIRISPDGTVLMSTRYTLTTVCAMQYEDFPFDEQACGIAIESYGHNANEIEYNWKNESSSLTVGDISNQEFHLKATKLTSKTIRFPSGSYMSLFVNVLFRRLSGRYYYEFFYPCSILAFIAIVSMIELTPIISVGISVAVICCSFLLTAAMASNYPSVGVTTTLDNFSAITNAFILMSFILSLASHVLKGADLGSEVHELSNLTRGRVRLGNDERDNLCQDQSGQPRPQLSKVQSAWRLVAAVFSKLLPLLKYLLAIIWVLVDLFYLSSRQYWPSHVVYLDDDWNLHG